MTELPTMTKKIHHNSTLLIIFLLQACAAPNSISGMRNCSSEKAVNLNLAQSPEKNDELGKEMLFGFLDSRWEGASSRGEKRCIMNIIPDEGSVQGIRIVTASHCLPDLGELKLDERSHAVYLFSFSPQVNPFQFTKGDSGSLLNIFGGYPIAALSTVDGEPTSGGSGLTPLPEPRDDESDLVSASRANSSEGCL